MPSGKRQDAVKTLADVYTNAAKLLPSINESVPPEICVEMLRDVMMSYAAEMEFELAARARDCLKDFKKAAGL